jgi:Mn2+/Fe2+ NRAMP family transporter
VDSGPWASNHGGESLLCSDRRGHHDWRGRQLLPIDPIKALYWSAVINGAVAVQVMAMMMLITANLEVMGKFTIAGPLRAVGWAVTFVMAAAVAGMALTALN